MRQSKDASTRNRGWNSGQRNNGDFFFGLIYPRCQKFEADGSEKMGPPHDEFYAYGPYTIYVLQLLFSGKLSTPSFSNFFVPRCWLFLGFQIKKRGNDLQVWILLLPLPLYLCVWMSPKCKNIIPKLDLSFSNWESDFQVGFPRDFYSQWHMPFFETS